MPASMKSLIADKFEEMARTRPIDRITVTDLVQACGISRQTFYYHYQDILDVVETNLHRVIDDLQARSRAAGSLEEVLRLWLASGIEHSSQLRKLMNSQHREHIGEVIRRTVHACFRDMVRTLLPSTAASDGDQEMALNFCAYGLAGIVMDAAQEEHPDVNRLAEQINRLLFREFQALPA